MNAPKNLRALRIFAAIALLMLLPVSAASSQGLAGSDSIPEVQPEVVPEWEVLNVHLDVPTGARIDYLRIFYYDISPSNSTAWVTIYDGAGGYSDLTLVSSTGAAGYGTSLSGFVNHVVDNLNNAYVLNWRPYQLDKSMQLCGLRVAYRLPTGPSTWSEFYYVFAGGSTLLPRGSGVGWSSSPDGGCTFLDYRNFLPIIRKG